MNDAERRELETYATEHVADGIVRYGTAGMSEGDRRAFVEKLAREAIDEAARSMVERGVTTPSAEEEDQIVRRLVATQLGLGRLQLLLDEDDIENININGADHVWVKRADGTKERVEAIADCDADLVELVQRAARAHHTGGERRIDAAKPVVDLHLAGGHRLSAMIEVSNRPCVSIRRHRLVDPTLDDLADSLSDELARFLRAAVRARLNMIISGGTDAGKTTLLRALAAEADPADRIVTIELSYELGLHELPHRHPDCVAWETREANTEGQGAVSMDYLVLRANRHDADRVIVGEVLGDEIVPMLNAMTAGKAGSMCTIHADSTEGTFGKIKTYASQSPKHLSDQAAAQLSAQALDLVIFVRKRPDPSGLARRYVSSVRVVEDSDGPHVDLDRDLRRARGRWSRGAPSVLAARAARPLGRRRLRGPPPPGLRTMTPVVVLFGAGAGVGLALVVGGIWSTARAGQATVLDEADRSRQPPGRALRSSSRRHRRPGHPLAGRRRHRRGDRLDTALRTRAEHLAARRRTPRGPGHLDRGAARQRGGASRPARRHRVDRTQRPAGDQGTGRPPDRAHQERQRARRGALRVRGRAGRRRRRRGDRPAHPGRSLRRLGPRRPLGQRGSEYTRADRAVAAHRGGPVQTAA